MSQRDALLVRTYQNALRETLFRDSPTAQRAYTAAREALRAAGFPV